MTAELTILLLLALFASSLWIPYIIGVNTTSFEGQDESFVRPPDHRNMEPWVHRAFRAHQNLLEQSMPFAIVVLIGHLAGVSNAVTVWCAVAFLALRVAHAIGMITAWTRLPARPLIFTAGWIITMIYGVQLLLA